jgi:microcystin-dependent protein
MTLQIKHPFQSVKADGLDATQVQPTNWNAAHTITMAADKVVGRSGTDGAAQELAFTALAQALAATGTADAFLAALGVGGFTTGDVKFTLKATADAGWIMANDGTIGDASSSATTRANADCQTLFTLLWNNVSDAYAPVSGGRGATAADDWTAHKRIALTKMLGRALAVAGVGLGLATRVLGSTAGAEQHAMTAAEMPVHDHLAFVVDPTHDHSVSVSGGVYGGSSTGFNLGSQSEAVPRNASAINVDVIPAATGISATVGTAGAGLPHNNMQPSSFLNAMIKL